MVNIKVENNTAESKVKGPALTVGFEMSKVAELVVKKDKQFAEDIIFGLCQVLSKKEIDELVETVFTSKEEFNKRKKDVDSGYEALLNLLKSLGDK